MPISLCRRAIELVESQSHPTTPSHPHKSPHPPSLLPHKDTSSLCVKLPHVASVISSVYSNSAITLSHSTAHTLPLQQKLAIATLLLCVRGKTVKEVTLGKLQDAYSRVCCQWQVKQEGQTEFVGLCHVLESRGLLSVKKAKETRMTKVSVMNIIMCNVCLHQVEGIMNILSPSILPSLPTLSSHYSTLFLFAQVTLKLQESEVEHVLQDQPLLSSVLKQHI